MKGFPAWPGKIVLPPDDLKRPGIKKLLHCVYFFGTHDFGWLSEQDVKRYHEFRDSLIGGAKTHSFQKALKEVEEFTRGKNIIDSIKEPVPNSPELMDTSITETNHSQISKTDIGSKGDCNEIV